VNTEVNPFEPPKATLDVALTPEAGPALWNPDAAGAWSLLITPVFGSVLVRKNWQAIGDEAKVRTGTVWIAVSILLFAAVMIVPFGGLLWLPYIIVWYFAWQRPQRNIASARRDYPRKGWGAPLLIHSSLCRGLRRLRAVSRGHLDERPLIRLGRFVMPGRLQNEKIRSAALLTSHVHATPPPLPPQTPSDAPHSWPGPRRGPDAVFAAIPERHHAWRFRLPTSCPRARALPSTRNACASMRCSGGCARSTMRR
jgi:hypothetical protein